MAARSPNNIRRRRDGLYEGRIVVAYRDGTKKRQSYYGATVDEVKEQLRRAQAQRRSFQPKNITTGDFLALWLDTIKPIDGITPEKPRVRFSTYCVRKQTVDRHIRNTVVNGRPFGSYKLDDLQPSHIRHLLQTLNDTGVRSRARQVVYETLRCALNYAIADEYIENNPTARVARPDHKPKETAILRSDQLPKLLDAIDKSPHRALFLLAVTSALRQGEILGLRWNAIDFDRGTLAVEASLSRVRKGRNNLGVTAPKTDTSIREIVLEPETLAALREHRKALLAKGLACEWVFPTSDGRPMERNNFRKKAFHSLLKAIGDAAWDKVAKKPRVTFHGLRHLAATQLVAEGIGPKHLQAFLGHADVKTTLNVYTHVTDEMRKETAKLSASMLKRMRGVG